MKIVINNMNKINFDNIDTCIYMYIKIYITFHLVQALIELNPSRRVTNLLLYNHSAAELQSIHN